MPALSLTPHKEPGTRRHRTFVQANGLAAGLVSFRKSWDSCFFSHFLMWMRSWEGGAAAESSWIRQAEVMTWRRMLGGSWHERAFVSFQDLGEDLWRWRCWWGVSFPPVQTLTVCPLLFVVTPMALGDHKGSPPTSPALEASSVSLPGPPVLPALHSPSCLTVSYSKVPPRLPEITLGPAAWLGSQVLQFHLGKEKPFNLISASEIFMSPIKKVLFYPWCVF